MSTNYFFTKIPTALSYTKLEKLIKTKPIAEALNFIKEEEREIHIGQFASGWKFLFRWNLKYYKNYNQLIKFLETGEIRDEYKRIILLEDFIEIIQKAQDKKSRFLVHKSEYDKTVSGYEFMNNDFF